MSNNQSEFGTALSDNFAPTYEPMEPPKAKPNQYMTKRQELFFAVFMGIVFIIALRVF